VRRLGKHSETDPILISQVRQCPRHQLPILTRHSRNQTGLYYDAWVGLTLLTERYAPHIAGVISAVVALLNARVSQHLWLPEPYELRTIRFEFART
jgi:hypothetical protein